MDEKAYHEEGLKLTPEQALARDLTPKGMFIKKMWLGRKKEVREVQEHRRMWFLNRTVDVLSSAKRVAPILGHVVSLGVYPEGKGTLAETFEKAASFGCAAGTNPKWVNFRTVLDIPGAVDFQLAQRKLLVTAPEDLAKIKGLPADKEIDDIFYHSVLSTARDHLKKLAAANGKIKSNTSLITFCWITHISEEITIRDPVPFSQLNIHTFALDGTALPAMRNQVIAYNRAESADNLAYMALSQRDAAEAEAVYIDKRKPEEKGTAVDIMMTQLFDTRSREISAAHEAYLASCMMREKFGEKMVKICSDMSDDKLAFISIPRTTGLLVTEFMRGTSAVSTEEFSVYTKQKEGEEKGLVMKEDSVRYLKEAITRQLTQVKAKFARLAIFRKPLVGPVYAYVLWYVQATGHGNEHCMSTRVGISLQYTDDRKPDTVNSAVDSNKDKFDESTVEWMTKKEDGFESFIREELIREIKKAHAAEIDAPKVAAAESIRLRKVEETKKKKEQEEVTKADAAAPPTTPSTPTNTPLVTAAASPASENMPVVADYYPKPATSSSDKKD